MKISYPKGTIKEDSEINLVEFEDSQLIDAIELERINIERRTASSLKDRSFHLSGSFDWIIVRDVWEELCLVPIKKEK